VNLVVIAKSPVPGEVKTRLIPPCTAEEAAGLAEAALADTLAAAVAAPVDRVILALEGPRGPWLPSGVEVIVQRGTGLAERLAATLEDAGGPAFVIGMDTPQVTPVLLGDVAALLEPNDAVLGPAEDGGYWVIGLRSPDRRVFEQIPMSTAGTLRAQLVRLRELELTVGIAPGLRDVDTFEDAVAVAPLGGPRFAAAVAAVVAGEATP
jgi:hypothetical protein